MEKEDPLVEEAEMEEEAATQDPREALPPEETRSLRDPTYLLTYDPSPAPTMRNQWESSPTSLPETEPKQKHSSTSLTTTSS